LCRTLWRQRPVLLARDRAAKGRDALAQRPPDVWLADAALEGSPLVVVQPDGGADVLHEAHVIVGGVVAGQSVSDAPDAADQPGAPGARPAVHVDALGPGHEQVKLAQRGCQVVGAWGREVF